MKSLGKKYTERRTLHEEAHIRTNEERINDTINDTDFMETYNLTADDIIKQVKTSKKEFDEISDYVANYKGTFGELYNELGGWNLGYNDVNKVDDNLFDCYYKSLLITVCVDDGKMSVQPTDVYVYPSDKNIDTDELFELDFNKPIDYSKLGVRKYENKELLAEQDLGEDFYEKICRAYVDTANLEWVTTNPENNNSIVHGYFPDDETADKYNSTATPDNFKELVDGDDYYEYDTWEDFYEEYVKDEIAYDMNDIGVYSINDEHTAVDKWDFYISEEDLIKLGLWNDDMRAEFLGESKKIESKQSDLYDELSMTLTDYEGNGDPDYEDDIECVVEVLEDIKSDWDKVVVTKSKQVKDLYDKLDKTLKSGNENEIYKMAVELQNNWETVITADLDENKKMTEDYSGNALDRTIVIENIYGNTLMSFKISPDGKLYEMENCDIADEEDAYIRIQQEEDWGEHTDLEDMYNDHKKQESKTWDDIFKDAEGTTFGQQAAKVKDQARAEVEELMRKDGIDVDNLESVEDEIEKYVSDHNIKFADNGCILEKK